MARREIKSDRDGRVLDREKAVFSLTRENTSKSLIYIQIEFERHEHDRSKHGSKCNIEAPFFFYSSVCCCEQISHAVINQKR